MATSHKLGAGVLGAALFLAAGCGDGGGGDAAGEVEAASLLSDASLRAQICNVLANGPAERAVVAVVTPDADLDTEDDVFGEDEVEAETSALEDDGGLIDVADVDDESLGDDESGGDLDGEADLDMEADADMAADDGMDFEDPLTITDADCAYDIRGDTLTVRYEGEPPARVQAARAGDTLAFTDTSGMATSRLNADTGFYRNAGGMWVVPASGAEMCADVAFRATGSTADSFHVMIDDMPGSEPVHIPTHSEDAQQRTFQLGQRAPGSPVFFGVLPREYNTEIRDVVVRDCAA